MAPALQAIGLCLVAIAYLLPGHYLPWATFQAQATAAMGFGFIGLAAGWSAQQRGLSVQWPVSAKAAVACAVLPWLQWSSGQLSFVSDALLASAYLAAFGLCIAAGAAHARADINGWLDCLFAALLVAGVLSVGIALMQWLRLPTGMWVTDLPRGARPFANLGQANHFATLVGVALVAAWRAYERGLLGKAPSALLVGSLLFGLVMAESRAGWLFALAFAGWLAAMHGRARLKTPPALAAVAVSALLAGIALWHPMNDGLHLGSVHSMAERLQAGPREVIWRTMLDAVVQRPWNGHGFNQVALAQQAVALDSAPVHRMLESAHNLWLDLALWGGVPLALLWALVAVHWSVCSVRRCHDANGVAVIAAAGAVLLHAQFEFPLESAYFLLLLGVLMGSVPSAIPKTTPRSPGPALLAMASVAMLCLLVLVSVQYLQLESSLRTLRLTLMGFRTEGASQAASDAPLLDGLAAYQRLMATPARANLPSTELHGLRQTAQRYPFPPAMLRHALAEGLNGEPANATRILQTLCAMHPTERCNEAHTAWAALRSMHPQLRGVAEPASPPPRSQMFVQPP